MSFVEDAKTDLNVRLIVSPTAGVFQPCLTGSDSEGDVVILPGTIIGTVGDVGVESPFAGHLMGFLRLPGKRVHQREALAWLTPLAVTDSD